MTENPLVTAFDIGTCLNQIEWHWLQAVVCGSEQDQLNAAQRLVDLENHLVRLFPHDRGGALRAEVAKSKRAWDAVFDSEWFAEHRHGIFARLNRKFDISVNDDDDYTTEEAIWDLTRPVFKPVPEIDASLKSILALFPDMQVAMHLGRCVDEGRHVPNAGNRMIVQERTPEWRPARKRQKALPAGSKRLSLTRHFHYVGRPLQPGGNAPADGWYDEIRVLWEKAGIASPIPPFDDHALTELNQFVAQVHHLARCGLEELACDFPRPEESWPPDNRWHFDETRFAILGKSYPLRGKMLQLLRLTAERPKSGENLWRDLWDGQILDVAEGAQKLRQLAFNLNKELRSLFGNSKRFPQIVSDEGRGADRLWSVELGSVETHSMRAADLKKSRVPPAKRKKTAKKSKSKPAKTSKSSS